MHIPDAMDQVDGREVAHGLLLAVLHEHGGSVELDTAKMTEAMGDDAGRMWSLVIEPTGDPARVRLSVVKTARPDSADPDPRPRPETEWTTADVLSYLAEQGRPVGADTWAGYVSRGQAPGPRRHIQRTPVWSPREIREWHQRRRPRGA